MSQIFARFLVGGAVVSVFAIVGDRLKPKSFAGLFGAAPSVALSTLGLTGRRERRVTIWCGNFAVPDFLYRPGWLRGAKSPMASVIAPNDRV
jgi:hypothetical protein